jgi:hypothetical protein
VAMQHTVRALIPAQDESTLRQELEALPGAGVLRIDSQQPPPATYRDEEPDRRLHQMWRASSGYLALAALLGALVGVAVAFLVPGLRDFLPYSALVLAFGFAWGGAAFGWGRGAQVAKREDDLGDERLRVQGREAQELRLLTIEVQKDREKVAEHLEARGAKLLDSRDPIVGEGGPLARPSEPEGPVVPEGQRPGHDGHGGHVTRGRGSDQD